MWLLNLKIRTSAVNHVRVMMFVSVIYLVAHLQGISAKMYTNQFAVYIPAGGSKADEIAADHQFTNLGQ
ncbi:unnamed protein product, partial [Allacma fusca]